MVQEPSVWLSPACHGVKGHDQGRVRDGWQGTDPAGLQKNSRRPPEMQWDPPPPWCLRDPRP